MIYVMSDIHGRMDRFDSILRQIRLQPEDTLYILGDVIDRNPDGIKILRRIMAMPNAKMLLGNHEYMMLNAIAPRGLFKEGPWTIHTQEDCIPLWYANGGRVTHNYLKHLQKTVRQEIFEYLYRLPIVYEIELGGTKYKMVHGSLPAEVDTSASTISPTYRHFAVWSRPKPWSLGSQEYTLIFGHTPTWYFQRNNPMKIWYSPTRNRIGIDCGCSVPAPEPDDDDPVIGRLACLRIDDMKEFYSE